MTYYNYNRGPLDVDVSILPPTDKDGNAIASVSAKVLDYFAWYLFFI